MKSFETTIKPLLKFGEGVSAETGKKFREYGCKKVLAGYDAKLPAATIDRIIDSITDEGIEVVRYACPWAEGQDTGVIECRQLAIDNNVDGFLAMGGGSTMDIVKAATLLIDKPLPLDQYFVGWYNGPDLPRKNPLISIPTTSGTGAEATRSYIIASQTLGVKGTISSQAAKADFVYLDPLVTMSMPPYVTATTGMDAIAHACEALCCVRSNIFTEMICGKSLELSWANLLTAYREPMIILPIVGRLINAYGYQVAYRCHAYAGFLLLLVTVLMISDTPEEYGEKPYGYEKAEALQAELAAKKALDEASGGVDLKTARKTPSYWLLWVGLVVSSIPGTAFRFYNGAFLRGPVGLDVVTYSNWASVLSVCIAIGMILMGVMADKIGSVKMVVIMHVISIAGYACAILLMSHTGSFMLMLTTIVLCGVNGPLDNATGPYLIPEAFGRKYYDEIIGSYAAAQSVDGILVPLILGSIISAGTYEAYAKAWTIIICFGIVAVALLMTGLFMSPYRRTYLAQRAEAKLQKENANAK